MVDPLEKAIGEKQVPIQLNELEVTNCGPDF